MRHFNLSKIKMFHHAAKDFAEGMTFTLLTLLVFNPVHAMTLPWERPLTAIQNSLQGPVAKGVAIIIFILTGLGVASGEVKGMLGILLRIAFGLSLALMAAQWLNLFGG